MDTYLKLTSVKNNKNCNCISPFYIKDISGINPNTGRDYSSEDIDALKTALYRISNAKGCNVSVCCDPNDPSSNPDSKFTKQFMKKFPMIMPMYEGSQLKSIKLSTIADVKESGWQTPTPHMICKITKATITDTKEPNIKMAINLVNDCFSDNCNLVEKITVNSLLQNAKADMNYTYFDDARVSQSILEGNISYVKEYIRKYKKVDIPLTNDDYNNRMVHLAAESKHIEILTMLIALKANINIQNKLRETPIHFAVRSKNLENINALLSQGVDLTIPNNNGETPMFYAMKTGDLRIVNMLYSNNSPIQGVDKNGNNLIHYCILNCPSYKENDDSVPNTKGEIIQFLIDRGISTEQKNSVGITPLELTSKQINKEINKECADNNEMEQSQVIEKFFNVNVNANRNGGATSQSISEYSPEHVSLLDIQTKLFNNILRNNPNKYSGYISVDDIPKGAPIEVLDTVCVGGSGITGNEDSDECIAKGGRISKIKNKTTKIKLELIPEEESKIANISQSDLYYPKENAKVPIGTVPINIANYNASIKANTNILPNVPQTTSITYNLGDSSTNTISSINNSVPQLTPPQAIPILNPSEKKVSVEMNKTSIEEHPNILEENDTVVSKCKKDAINNAIRVSTTTPLLPKSVSFTTTTKPIDNSIGGTFLSNYKVPIIILIVIILILIGYIMYLSISSSSGSGSNNKI
jgi:ankyrin repeat protein